MIQVYRKTFLSHNVVHEWCQKLKDGQANVHNEGGQGHKFVATEDLVQQVNQAVREKQSFTISEIKNWLGGKNFQANGELQPPFRTI